MHAPFALTRSTALMAAAGLTGLALLAPVALQAQTTTSVVREYFPGTTQLKSETRDGVTSTFTYDTNGEVATTTDARGVVTRYTNYRRGIAQKTERGVGTTEAITQSTEIDDLGCVLSETDGEGRTTRFTRDSFCRVLTQTPPRDGSAVTTFTYAPATAGTPETHTRTRGDFVEVSRFDGFGRQVDKTAAGVKRIWRHDGAGRVIFVGYPAPTSVASPTGDTTTYDAAGRLLRVTHADDTFVQHSYGVNASGRPTTQITDERGQTVTRTFRAFGAPANAELIAINTPVTAADATMKRNVRGQVIEVSQGGFTRTYGYDSRYFLTSVVNPETGTTTYGRDAIGAMVSTQVGASGVTHFDLDAHGRNVSIRYPESSRNVTTTWGKDGKRKTATNGTSTSTWAYDDNGNLTSESLSIAGYEFTTTYSHDAYDRRTAIGYPKKGLTLALAPDVMGRPTQVGPYVSTVAYHPNGRVRTMTYGNGVVTEMGQDSRQRPATLTAGKSGLTRHVDITLTHDGANNLGSITDAANASNNRVFGYDGVDRLTRVTHGGADHAIDYDGAGNIKRQEFGGALTYAYDPASNRLSSTAGVLAATFAYDARGNVVSDGTTSFRYDDNSRLRCAKCDTAAAIDYDYDALGLRISRTRQGQVSYQVHDAGGDLLTEFTPATNRRSEHVYLQGHKVATVAGTAYFATTLALSTSSAKVQPGQTVTLTAAVGGGRSPDGVVNFYDNGNLIGTGRVTNGVATLTTAPLAFGFHNFSAAYVGDGANVAANTAVSTNVESGAAAAALTTILNLLLED